MITLSKENVVDYVKSRLDFFNPDGDIKVSAIGEGTVEEDGDGFINFVYRVSDGEQMCIRDSIFSYLYFLFGKPTSMDSPIFISRNDR